MKPYWPYVSFAVALLCNAGLATYHGVNANWNAVAGWLVAAGWVGLTWWVLWAYKALLKDASDLVERQHEKILELMRRERT